VLRAWRPARGTRVSKRRAKLRPMAPTKIRISKRPPRSGLFICDFPVCVFPCHLRFHQIANVRYRKRDFCEGARVPLISEGSTTVLEWAGTRRFPEWRRSKLGCRPLLICAAALSVAGCSNEPLSPQGALWTGSSSARSAATAPPGNASESARTAYRSAAREGWGPYSGRRGQTSPPPTTDYAFKGDPNASSTFAGGPGQM
jgi:hypothetical protein